MEKNEFKSLTRKYFREHGFEKIKSLFYCNCPEKGLLCCIEIAKSNFSEIYYFDFIFYIGNFQKPYAIDRSSVKTYTPCVCQRFYFDEKYGYSCSYLDYTPEQLTAALDENMSKYIYPPFQNGKKYILEHFFDKYSTFLNVERIMKLLEE